MPVCEDVGPDERSNSHHPYVPLAETESIVVPVDTCAVPWVGACGPYPDGHVGGRQLAGQDGDPLGAQAAKLQLACNFADPETSVQPSWRETRCYWMPGLQLPEPSTEKLERSPLELVVCQVRHERNLAVADAKRALEVHRGLGGKYPVLDEAAGIALNIMGGPAGVSTASDQQRGWNLRSSDGAWTVVLMPEFFALETRAYTDWTDFSARLDELVGLVQSALEPSLEQRLGLRLIDRVKDPVIRSPEGWRGWIDDRLLGPVLHSTFGPAIKAVQQVLQLDGGDDMEVLLRHGCVPEGPADNAVWHYVLDHDCSRSGGRAFSPVDIHGGAERLHTVALAVFQAAVTEKLFKHLRGDA